MAKKILIVDDDPNSLHAAESILISSGYDIIALDNPKFIFKVIKTERPDLVLSDIIMPHSDGYSICSEIKKLYNGTIPVLLCTSQSYEQDLIQNAYKDFGAADFVLKPFKQEELVEKVNRIIGKSENPQI